MVRNSLNIENRICFDSDPSGGEEGGGFSKADADVGYGVDGGRNDGSAQAGDTRTSDAETDDPTTAGAGSTESGGYDSDTGLGTPGGKLGGYQGSTGSGFGGYAGSGREGNPTASPVNSYASPQTPASPGFLSKNGKLDQTLESFFDSPFSAVGILGRGLDSAFGLGTRGHEGVDTSGDGPDLEPAMYQRRQNLSEQEDGGELVIDDAAINYLQNPYYQYSGFGNQYNPYGFSNSTLVDLLQTRGMTQPSQADTLGLFADPRDFR